MSGRVTPIPDNVEVTPVLLQSPSVESDSDSPNNSKKQLISPNGSEFASAISPSTEHERPKTAGPSVTFVAVDADRPKTAKLVFRPIKQQTLKLVRVTSDVPQVQENLQRSVTFKKVAPPSITDAHAQKSATLGRSHTLVKTESSKSLAFKRVVTIRTEPSEASRTKTEPLKIFVHSNALNPSLISSNDASFQSSPYCTECKLYLRHFIDRMTKERKVQEPVVVEQKDEKEEKIIEEKKSRNSVSFQDSKDEKKLLDILTGSCVLKSNNLFSSGDHYIVLFDHHLFVYAQQSDIGHILPKSVVHLVEFPEIDECDPDSPQFVLVDTNAEYNLTFNTVETKNKWLAAIKNHHKGGIDTSKHERSFYCADCRKYIPLDIFTLAEHADYLTKQGGDVKNWKKRWAVLTKRHLAYYESEQDVNSLRVLNVVHCDPSRVQPVVDEKIKFLFNIASDKRVLACHTDTQEEFDNWLAALTEKSNSSILADQIDSSSPKDAQSVELVQIDSAKAHLLDQKALASPVADRPAAVERGSISEKKSNDAIAVDQAAIQS